VVYPKSAAPAAKAKIGCQMSVPEKSVRPAQYFFPLTAPGAKATPCSAKYSTLAAGIPFATESLEYSPLIFAISRAAEKSAG